MKILFYIGYQKEPFDGNTDETGRQSHIGGTEIAMIELTKEMVKFGYTIVVSGEVNDSGMIDGVEWISTNQLHTSKHFNTFDVIISSSYIHFLKEFKRYSAKKILWAHNTHHHPYYNGIELEDADVLIKQVDHTICLTDWHKNQWSKKYDIPLDKISVIGNGINTSTFIGNPNKIKGRFIYSSAPERGLVDLLKNWPKIKEALPHASLDIFSPSYSIANPEDYDCIQNNIKCHGSVNQVTLHDAMLRAEYWCYITDYEETYCITALEMQYANVIPIVKHVAALRETVNSGIILNDTETNWNMVIQTISTLSNELMNKSKNSAFNWAKKQTWNNRSHEWKFILDSI